MCISDVLDSGFRMNEDRLREPGTVPASATPPHPGMVPVLSQVHSTPHREQASVSSQTTPAPQERVPVLS